MHVNERLQSLDVFRGITVAAMILVNNPGDWSNVYTPLLHAPWHGCTPTDLIFPFFLFSVGVSIPLAYQAKKKSGFTGSLFFRIVKRTSIIFSLGLLLSLFPKFNFETVRIPGVLQRISIVFCACALLYLSTSWLFQLRLFIVLLVGYYLLMTLVPVPGVGAANLNPETNLAAWLDHTLLNGHLWKQSKTWDPEGILSTVPAIATGISGMLVGVLITSLQANSERVNWLFFAGAALIVLGLIWSLAFPINKSLWTSSYVLYTSGIAMQFLAFFYWLIDVLGYKKWSLPFVWFGVNALAAFVASGLLVKILVRIEIPTNEASHISVWSFIYKSLFASWLSPTNASLSFALLWVAFFGILLRTLYKKKIIIKV